MENGWQLALYFVYLSLFIFIANAINKKVGFLRNVIVPTAIIAGFTGLLLGPEFLGWVPFETEILGMMVYHLMAIGFIALSLKNRDRKRTRNIVSSGIYIVSTYLVQGIVGFGLGLVMINTLFPDLFVGFGLLLPLGYGQGPGQAFSIGSQWEALGFTSGGNIGLTVATFGFLWASVIGIPFMNYLVKGQRVGSHQGAVAKERILEVEVDQPLELSLSETLDKITYQLVLIGVVYLMTYLTLVGLTRILVPLGTFGMTFATLLWGFHFNIGSIYGIILRVMIDKGEEKGWLRPEITNNYLLQRISGATFDYMITASIAAISILAFRSYFVPVMVLTTVGGLVTLVYTSWMLPRVFKTDTLENIVAFYGMQTGTISTGMGLLKGVDPHFSTDAAENLVLGSAVAIFLGAPLMVILNIPIMGYVSGRPALYLLTLGLFAGYLLFLYLLLYLNIRRGDSEQHLAAGMKKVG
ncbi:MAG: sodium:glutamate symporter [delta proteobacterium ML8_F1]|nr:MAG: sodium:glutamate symporter [delta proteobacterium ML8_F1]